MRFALSPNDRRIHDLVVALDADVPIAQTWRRVGEAAERLGLRRPSYTCVSRLAKLERLRRDGQARARRAAVDAAMAFTSPRVVDFVIALDRLEDAKRDVRLVLQQHKPPSPRANVDAEG